MIPQHHLRDKLFVASSSPRRREICSYLFESIDKLIISGDEPRWEKHQNPLDYLHHCLEFKWNAALSSLSSNVVSRPAKHGLIVADTIVVLGKEVLGKPSDAKDAEKMLSKLSGKTHTVYTGYRLAHFYNGTPKDSGNLICETKVSFRQLSPKEIRSYVKTGDPMDKAGAYGAQGGALRFISNMDGSYYTVMGLPVEHFAKTAENLGFQ